MKEQRLTKLLCFLLLPAVFSLAAPAQKPQPPLRARELFYAATTTKAAAEKSPAAPKLGLRYSLLKEESANRFREVDPDTVFRTGDHIRLSLEANDSGYLYIVQRGASGR